MRKIFGFVALFILMTSTCIAMTFSQPKKIGEIGFPVQAPYHGIIIEGAVRNDGKFYIEEQEIDGRPVVTFQKGTAVFGFGKNQLYCKYDFDGLHENHALKFGGKNDFVLERGYSYKELFSIPNNGGITLYAVYHNYCVSHLDLIGQYKNGKWVHFLDSKKISDIYFDGKDSYKEESGVIYEVPTCKDDTIIIKYGRWNWTFNPTPEGELILTWDGRAQNFNVTKVVY